MTELVRECRTYARTLQDVSIFLDFYNYYDRPSEEGGGNKFQVKTRY